MRRRQSHWPVLTYYHPCFDFSKSIRANAHNLINIHVPSSLVRFIYVISGRIRSCFVILSVLFLVFPPFFIETLNDKQYLKHPTSPKFSQHDKYAFICHGSGCLPGSSGCLCCPVRFVARGSGQSVLIGQRECTDHELTLPHLSLISPPLICLYFSVPHCE